MLENNKQSSLFASITLTKDILPNVLSKTLTRANNCRVFKIKYKHRSKTRVILMVRCFEDYSNPKGHLVSLGLDIPKEKREQVLKSNRTAVLSLPMKVYCTCQAYKYWGSHYIATKKGYNINTMGKELRPPVVRDPLGKNIVCKHITAVANSLKSQSVYKALKGKSNQSEYSDNENVLLTHIEGLPELSVEECQAILEGQGYTFNEELTQDNFETNSTNFIKEVLNA